MVSTFGGKMYSYPNILPHLECYILKVFLVFSGTLGLMGEHTYRNKPFILGSHAEYKDLSGCKWSRVK